LKTLIIRHQFIGKGSRVKNKMVLTEQAYSGQSEWRLTRFALGIWFFVAMTSCSNTAMHEQTSSVDNSTPPTQLQQLSSGRGHEASGMISNQLDEPGQTKDVALKEIYQGTGTFINSGAIGDSTEPGDGDVTLNFQDSPITEVVKTILGDILGENYALSADVSGVVSMRTTRAIPRDALVSVLDNLLRMNGAAVIKNDNYYEVVSIQDSGLGGLSPGLKLSSDKGYQIQIVPLRFIGAKAMAEMLEPVKSGKATVMVDEFRNILTIAGSQSELFSLRDTITIFDVNQLSGMSVGLFRVQNVEAATIVTELEAIFGDSSDGPLAGMVRFTVIERLNALMVISPQEKYLGAAETWIRRLDQSENPHGTNMYVYYVQNGDAEHLADLLTQLFEGRRRSAMANAQREEATAQPLATSAEGGADAGAGGDKRVSSTEIGDASIIPDIENNALLILATAADYAEVEKAVQKLDVPPMQVLVEASIVEVTLSDELEYGLQWFFSGSPGKYDGAGGLNIPASGDVSSLAGVLADPVNFTYRVFDAAGTRAVLNAIAGDARIDVLSSPTLMVLDNKTATIRVGDQVPIRTEESTNTSSSTVDDDGNFGNNVTSRIQYRDTGVTLEVTPRVNAGGMVIMEVTQRVDDVDETTTSGIDSPTILQREITTSVAVQSGETIVLGGLIREDKEVADSGVPFLKDIPGLGVLFRNERIAKSKTELVVMITPSAIANPTEARRVTEEYKSKLGGVDMSMKR
jgi:general secretion pathway protein D